MSNQTHPYHLVDPSPWPIMGAVGAFLMAFGAVTFFHDRGDPWVLLVGLAVVLATMALWWRDVVHEGSQAHTMEVRHGLRVGMVLFIASEVMFFAAFFWAFFNAALGVNPSVVVWPPHGIQPMHTWSIPFVNTLILMSSGLSVNWAHHCLERGDRRGLWQGLALAIVLGITFVSLQAYEYGEAAFGFTQGIYPSVFYMATGFHGFHVLVGVTFLSVNLIRAIRGDFTPAQHVGFQAAAWYWHFVDAVWVFLFVWVYWWGNG